MKNNETKPGSKGQKHMEKEKTKHEEEDNDVMAGVPPTYHPANAGKVGPRLNGLQNMWFGEKGKRA